MTMPVLIMAGGTGGHVFPALAVAERLREQGVPVVWLGTREGLEARVVPAADIPLESLRVRGLRGNGLRGWLAAPFVLLRALWQALGVLRRHRPRAVLGMGGYAAGPGAVAAWLTRRPLIIHEQNAVAGLTNRLLSRLARRVLTGFPGILPERGGEHVGNPVRDAITRVPGPADRGAGAHEPLRLLVVGGSLGALALNSTVPAALARLPEVQRPVVRHQAGERTLQQAREAYDQAGIAVDLRPFIEDMAAAWAWADLAICRAGALTVAELEAVGVPAILVPLPGAVDDHQTANARQFVAAGAGVLLPQSELSAQRLALELKTLLADPPRLQRMAQCARGLGRPDAAATVARICLEEAR
ncbi:undecaprenyldiphospho-muramoylpentapeptide beta-N-acetylglucosaminyltransferase [Alkalilimnicola ehrlichii]|uniref:undecaprenyldiphospho-muramoylpentapeptide beta-N-acetylglucosaminyltransferase n=1 Tax=Alkalilimnicola ehrlichii TaxID=351052 RepID=UPI003BA229F7